MRQAGGESSSKNESRDPSIEVMKHSIAKLRRSVGVRIMVRSSILMISKNSKI
jgi:hypothetical protein